VLTAVFRPVDVPRPPSPAELRLLTTLAAEDSELVAQVRACSIVGECRCGCGSLELHSVTAPLAPDVVAALSADGRGDHLAITADGVDAAGRTVEVTLHVLLGSVRELELFDPSAGEGRRVDPASISSLGRPRVD
jgi:hypothetical protein